MRRARRNTVVVLHDLAEAKSAIQRELAQASEQDAPGLRRALSVLTEIGGSDAELKYRWAVSCLRKAGVEPGDNSARAIKELRQAMPELGLADAADVLRLAQDRP